MDFIEQYFRLPRSIYMLVLARIINNFGYFVFPFLTLFMSVRLGLDEESIGRYLLVSTTLFVPAAMISGKLADHFNRKTIYVTVQSLGYFLIFICGFLGDSKAILYVLLVSSFMFGMQGPINSAITMDLTTPKNRKASMSLLYLGMNIGTAVGPLFAGLLFESHTSWLFWGDGISGLLATLIVVLGVPDTTPTKEQIALINADKQRAGEASASGSVFKALLKRPVLLSFAIIDILLSLAYSQTGFLMPLQAKELFGIAEGAKFYGYAMALNGAVVVLLTVIIVVLTKRFSAIWNMVLAAGFFAVGFGMFAFTKTLGPFLFFTAIWTVGEILSATNMGVYIANHSPVTHRARFQSICDIIGGAGRAIGPAIIGAYLVGHTIPNAWILTGVLCFIALIAYVILDVVDKKGSSHEENTVAHAGND